MSKCPAAPLDRLKQQAWARRVVRGRRIARVEPLEHRRLLAASVDDRVLTVDGTGGDDVISITNVGGGDVSVDVNGADSTFDADDFDAIVVNGLNGDDRLTVGQDLVGASLFGGGGDDTLQPGGGNDPDSDPGGDDRLSGGGGNDVVQYLVPSAIDFRLFEGYKAADATSPTPYILVKADHEFDDRIADDVERIIGGPGREFFFINRNGISAIPLGKALTIEGGDGDDVFDAGQGLTTTQLGGAGDDRLETHGESDETLVGGDGNDSFDFGPSNRATVLTGGPGIDDILLADSPGSTLDLRLYPDVENANVIFANQTAIGNDLDNELVGRGTVGPFTLIGGNGNDTLYGSDLADSLDGGAGDDVALGFSGNDTLEGGDGDDLLLGAGQDDSLDGGAGTDTVMGGFGDDSIANAEVQTLAQLDNGTLRVNGTLVADQLSISDDDDELVVSMSGDEVRFDIDDVAGIELNGNGGSDLLELDETLTLSATLNGGAGHDILSGGAAGDQLNGGDDDDSLVGNDGNDTLDGGLGSDILRGSAGRDTMDYSNRTANLIIGVDELAEDGELGEGDLVEADIEIVLGGSGHDRIGGSAGDDELHGMGGHDTIQGGGGDDSLFGWHGNDIIHGDAGNDYVEAGAGHDAIFGDGGGDDTMFGLAGNDSFFTSGNGFNRVIGGRGTDTADLDPFDDVQSVEILI